MRHLTLFLLLVAVSLTTAAGCGDGKRSDVPEQIKGSQPYERLKKLRPPKIAPP